MLSRIANKDSTMTQDIKRQRILDKIRKLQSKTTAMGCTEAEALDAGDCKSYIPDAFFEPRDPPDVSR